MQQQCTIDEAMIPFKGIGLYSSSIWRTTYKVGCESLGATNGYVKIFQICTGIGVGTDSSIGLCSRVVLDLIRALESSGIQTITMLSYSL